eukprot:355017-Chlamydomonas_euryale.AAC.2
MSPTGCLLDFAQDAVWPDQAWRLDSEPLARAVTYCVWAGLFCIANRINFNGFQPTCNGRVQTAAQRRVRFGQLDMALNASISLQTCRGSYPARTKLTASTIGNVAADQELIKRAFATALTGADALLVYELQVAFEVIAHGGVKQAKHLSAVLCGNHSTFRARLDRPSCKVTNKVSTVEERVNLCSVQAHVGAKEACIT